MFKVNNKNTKTSPFDHFVGLALKRLNLGIDLLDFIELDS